MFGNIFGNKEKKSASLAKERLKIVVAHQRGRNTAPEWLPQLEKEILELVSKYVDLDPQKVNVKMNQQDQDTQVLELNVELSEDGE